MQIMTIKAINANEVKYNRIQGKRIFFTFNLNYMSTQRIQQN